MVIELKHAVVVKANAFENAVPIEETVVEDGDFCVVFAYELAVEVNLHGGFGCVPRG